MPKSTSSRSKNGSEVSSRSERRRTEDDQSTKSRARDDSETTSSSSRRKSSKRDDDVEKAGWMPDSTSFSSSSRAPHAGMAAPSVASSYATAFTKEPQPFSQPPQLVRNESMTNPLKRERKDEKRERYGSSKSENRRDNTSDDDSRNVGRRDSERSSRRESRKSSRKESSRSLNDHDASLPQNQFPGQGPAEYSEPYRPPGHAAEYYGDHGESVQSQPGVRPNPPSVIQTADQAHLMQPTTEAKPPAEPSSLGQVGAAASFFGMDGSADDTAQQSTPSKPGRKTSSRPSKSSRYNDGSRGSPGPSGSMSGSVTASTMGAAAVSSGIGQAAEYYSGNIPISRPVQGGESFQQGPPPRTESPESYAQSSRPPKGSGTGSQSVSHHYGGAAVTGLAGAAAVSYMAGQTGKHHEQYSQSGAGPSSGFVVGQGQSAFPGMQQQRRQKRRGPLGKLMNFFKDPAGVAEFEAYTEAIGVCRHCFDPNSSPADAPRKHHYHHHRGSSGSRYGSTTRVDKTYRYSSSDDGRRRTSTAKKVVAGGLTGYGAAKIGEAVIKQKYDFDDTYSVKSGRPADRSRVSFKEEEDRYSSRVERRDSKRRSRRDDKKYEKRSSRRRDSSSSSSSSSHGVSRGNVLGVAAGATGLAMGAEALHRRRSRSRSRSSSRRKYYSKRVSPRHSYVDLSATTSGGVGLTGFFSPSSNNKKGKKPKGLFNFGNVSSSSSDADLAFGEGTVKRKPSKKVKGKENDTNYGSTAAILGLAATGAALAAESDRRESKGKERRHADGLAGQAPRRSSSSKIKLQDHESTTDGANDDAWEDASDDDRSSVDTALAYGGRASAAQSRESLQGTDKWDSRWRPNKERRNEKLRRQSSDNFDAAATGLAGAGIGAMAAGMMSTDSTPKPPLRHIDPVPTSDPSFFDARQSSAITGISPFSSTAPPEHFATSSSVPLQQPQPVFSVAAVPDKFGRLENEARYSDSPHPMDDGRVSQRELDRKNRSRRDSSPANLPSHESRGTVSFNRPDTLAEEERRELDKDQPKRSRREDKERRRSADSTVTSKTNEDTDPKQRRQSSEYDRREAEIEAELQRLYEEERKRKDRQRKQDDRDRKVEGAGVAVVATAFSAGVAAGAKSKNDKRSSSSEDITPRRKSIMKKGKERDVSPQGDTQQERIARMAAQRVRSTASPVHEDYQSFFVPTEIAEHVKEHNEESAHRDDPDPHVVEIVPGALLKKKETFDPFNYRPFGIDPDDDPTLHPWPVPMLGLVEPTPPPSRTHSLRSTPNPSPRMEPVKEEEEGEDDIGEQLERRSSRITWGDDDINIYEAMTPEWERSDFIPDLPDQARDPSRGIDPPPETERERPRSGLNRVYTIDDDATFVPPVDKASDGLPGAFPAAESGERLPQQVDVPPAEGDRVSTPTMDDLNDMLRGSPFYAQRFSDAVSDPADMNRSEPQTGHGFVEDRELAEVPKDGIPRPSADEVQDADKIPADRDASSGPRLSKSERRRMERAAGLEDTSAASAIPEPQADRPVSGEEAQAINPASGQALDYPVDDDEKSSPPASALGVAASTVLLDGRESSTDVARDALSSSVRATPAEVEDSSKPERSSDTDKKSDGGIWSNIFGGAKSDVSNSSKKSSKSTRSDDPAGRGRSKDSVVSADETANSQINVNGAEEPSFLAKRPEMPQPTDMRIPMATDGVSGLQTEDYPSDQRLSMPIPPAPLVAGDQTTVEVHESKRGSQSAITDYFAINPTQAVSPASRRVSGLRTTDLPSSPVIGTSPTAVPFNTRRFPVSPATPRASWSSPIASPGSPLTASRTRQGRPKSTEFRSAREFRPLYLVQKSIHEKSPSIATPEVEEDLPSLPSSRTSSAHPSMENLRGEAERQDYFDIHQMTPEQFRERGRRHSASYWRDEPRRRISPDYLDSRSATPVPADFSRALDLRGKKEKPKYEFHSPSELLQDPAMNPELAGEHHEPPRPSSPLPSVVSTDHEDFMSARSGSPTSRVDSPDSERQRSRPRSRSESSARRDTVSAIGLGLGGGAALAVAATEALTKDDGKPEEKRDIPESEDLYGGDVIPFAAAPPPPPPPPPPSVPGPTSFTRKTSKRSVTEPAASVSSTATKGRSESSKEGGMGSIAAMVAAKANQMKENKARKSVPTEPVPDAITRAIESQEPVAPTVATETTAKPESTTYDEIASAEALIAASRALRGADIQGASKEIPVFEPITQDTHDPRLEPALETPASDLKLDAMVPVPGTSEDKLEAIPIASNLIDTGTETPAETPAEEPEEWAFPTKKSKKDKRKASKKATAEAPASQETTELPTSAEEINERAVAPDKKSKKDKKKGKRQESLTPLDISKAEARDETGERTVKLDDDEPLTAISSDKRSEVGLPEPTHEHERGVFAEEVLPEAEAVEEALQARKIPVENQPAEVGDVLSLEHPQVQVDPTDHWSREQTFDPATGLSEHGSRMSFPWDDEDIPATLSEDAPRQLGLEHQVLRQSASEEAAAAFVPSATLLNKPGNDLGALEEAFERALRARGLPQGLSREDALSGFLPKRNNAPFIAKGGLTPIVGSEASSPADKSPPAEEEIVSHPHPAPKPSKKDIKRSRKLDRRGSSLRQMSLSEDEGDLERGTALPSSQDYTQIPTILVREASSADVQPLVVAAEGERDGPNPFGDDFEVRPEHVEYQAIPSETPLEPAIEATRAMAMDVDARDLGNVVDPETPNEATAEELSWAPVSKKDKKKKKKSQTSTPAESATPSERTPLETPSEPAEIPREQIEDDWATPTTNKAKKSKKDKKRQTLDWIDKVAPEAGATAAAIAAGAAIGATVFEEEKKPDTAAEPKQLLEPAAAGEEAFKPPRELEQPLTGMEGRSISDAMQATQSKETDLEKFASVPTSKKDKEKKKSKSTAFDWDDTPTGTTTPGEEDPTLPTDRAVSSITTEVGDVVTFSVPETKDETVQDMPAAAAEASVGAPIEAADDEWSEAPKKQSKKDKRKGKKGKGISLTDLPGEDSTPQSPAEPELMRDAMQGDTQLPDVVAKESLTEALSKVPTFPSKLETEETGAPLVTHDLRSVDSVGDSVRALDEDHVPAPSFTAVEDPATILEAEKTVSTSAEVPRQAESEELPARALESPELEQVTEEESLFQPSKKSKKDKKKAKKKSLAFDDWDEPSAEPAAPTPEVRETIQDAVAHDIGKERQEILAPVEESDNSNIKGAVAVDVGNERKEILEPVKESQNNIKEGVAANIGMERDEILEPLRESENEPIKEAIATNVGKERDDFFEPVEESTRTTEEPQPLAEVTPAETPVEEENQFAWNTSKKSKKDNKKAKKRTSTFADAPEIASPSPEAETPIAIATSSERILGADVASGTLAGAVASGIAVQSASDTPVETLSKELEDDFAWQRTSKKGKKDKKKRKSLAWADEEVSTPASQESDLLPVEETTAIPVSRNVLTEPDSQVQTSHTVEESEPNLIDGATGSQKETHDVAAMAQAARAVEKPTGMTESEKARESVSEATVLPTEIEEPSEAMSRADTQNVSIEAQVIASEEPEEFSWAPATKKSKKDKKKKRGSAFDFDSPAEGTSTPEPEAETSATDIVAEEVTTTEPATTEEEWGFTSKKSKKDKKKKGRSTLTFDEAIEEAATPGPAWEAAQSGEATQPAVEGGPTTILDATRFVHEAEPIVHEAIPEEKAVLEAETVTRDVPTAQAMPAPIEPEVEEDWGFSTKKSKKDKKKNRASQLAFDDPSEPSTSEPLIGSPAEEELAARDVAMEDLTPAPVAEPVEEWGSSTKKSKKDKKKKRASTFALDESGDASTPGTETPALEDAAEPEPAAEPEITARAVVPDGRLAAPAIEAEEWASSTKKSKKDKKKKRGSALAWDDSTPAESDVPAEVKEVGTTQEPEALDAMVQNQPVAEVVKEPSIAESETLPESMEVEPTREAFGAARGPEPPTGILHGDSEMVGTATAPQFELSDETTATTREVEAEAEVEDWGFPTKKSKKDKKKKREAALASDETPPNASDAALPTVGPGIVEAISEPESSQKQIEPEPEPEEWSFSTKKSKKDKKKRKSIPGGFGDEDASGSATPSTPMETEPPIATPAPFDEPTIEASRNADAPALEDVVQPVDNIMRDPLVTDEPASIADVSTILPETPVEDAPDDVWGFSTKKSKKDKKKKRQSTLREESAVEDPSFVTTPAEPAILERGTEAATQEPQRELEPEVPKPESEETTEADAPIDWANDPWRVSTKKPKKDKKKKKATFEELGDIPAEAESSRDGNLPQSLSHSAQEKAADMVAMAFADDRRERSRSRSRSREAPATSVEVPTDIHAAEQYSAVEPEFSETATPAEAVEEGWGFGTKKPKKDKKKKRQSTFDDIAPETRPDPSSADVAGAMMMEAFSMSEDRDATVDDQPTHRSDAEATQPKEAPPTDLPMPDIATARIETSMPRALPSTVHVKEIDDYEFGRASPLSNKASASEPALAPTQTLGELEEEPIQRETEASRKPADEEDWYAPASKSKKDKKKKKRQSGLEEVEDQYSADISARTTDEKIGPLTVEDKRVFEEAAPEDEWSVGRKKSKKDKKKQNSQSAWEEEAESTPRSLGAVEEPHRPEDYPSMRERSSSLKASVRPIGQMSQPSVAEEEPFVPGEFDAGVPPVAPEPPPTVFEPHEPDRSLYTESAEPTPAQEDGWYSTPKKGKKSKKDKKATRTSTREYDGTAIAAEASSSAKWQEQADGAEDTYPVPAQDPEDIRMDDSDGSRVSESTRERRRRRRSPKAYNGEELPDLPRPLATPPPEHDDIMDTALGIAAGIGFGKSESERAPRPKSATPRKTRRDEPSWSFDNVATAVPRELQEGNRDSAIQFDSPTLGYGHPTATRDSGYVPSPATGHVWDQEALRADDPEHLRPARPQSPTSSTEDVTGSQRQSESTTRRMLETPAKRQPSPIESTTKDRSSVVFKSSPAASSPYTPHIDTSIERASPTDIRRSPSIHGHHLSREQLRSLSPSSQPRRTSDSLASNLIDRASAASVDRAVFSPPPYSNMSGPLSPPKSPLHSIPEHRQSTDFAAAAVLGAVGMGAATLLARDSTSSPTGGARSLGRSKSRTSSLRNLRGSLTSPTPYDPHDVDPGRSSHTVDEARASGAGEAPATSFSSARDVLGGGAGGMADVYDGYGAHPATPTSPSRPPSITRRRSMQQIQDLQTRVEQLASENRMLAEAKIVAERHLEEFHLDRNRAEYATEEALREAELKVQDRDEEIDKLKQEVEEMAQQHDEHARSMGVGTAAGLAGAAGLAAGAVAGGSWEEDKQELEDLRSQHRELSTGVDEIVRREVDTAVAEKTLEIERLQNDLTLARQRIKEMQSQILRERSQAGGDSIIVFRDEDYFDQKCQELCQHVQGWVLRFSKFSDSRVCRSTNEVRDEKVVDRFDNAILDGSDVDTYLGDRVKRRDVFMSVVMTMIWEYVFTRYLFGMDREQRQKLKQLEKNLGEVGSKAQVGQWRAMTLTLLSKREGFRAQCESDTQAVSYEILGTLSKFLPPPANLQEQILETLRGVLRLAVQVSVEMRCQGAEYIMLPPLQPEYDTNGDLMRKVFFNASLMNERSGETKSNEELQEQGAVVRVVLFPLVVKKGGEEEGEEEEIVVCPAQVLVARVEKGKKVQRSSSGKQSQRVASGRSEGAVSTQSLGAMSGVEMGGERNVI